MSSYSINNRLFSDLISNLNEKYILYAPTLMPDKGKFSGTDLVIYAQINSFDELEYSQKSDLSPKSIVFPPDQTLFYFTKDKFSEPIITDEREIIVFARPCDINAFDRLDKMFIDNGGSADCYYSNRRKKIKFFMIECTEAFENCFCISMNSEKTDNYSVALKFEKDRVLAQVKDSAFASFFKSAKEKIDYKPEFVKTNPKVVALPEVEQMPQELFKDEIWHEYAYRCIACGRCNTSCPTCSCFTTFDVFYEESRDCGERKRIWASCHIDGFTKMAGGHSYRTDKGERMRFKTFHKVYDFKKRFGVNMCVGCGRCDDQCPEYISFSSCINKLSKRLEEISK